MKKGKIKKKGLKKDEKRKVVAVLVLFLIILIGIIIENRGILGAFLGIDKEVIKDDTPEVSIDYNNLVLVLSSSSLIQDLPKDGTILLKFFNFNNGERQWEKSYILKKGEVTEGDIDNPDLLIILHSKYLNGLTNKNFCSMVQTANKNGDLGLDYQISKTSLLWKFKGMMKHRNCFGF